VTGQGKSVARRLQNRPTGEPDVQGGREAPGAAARRALAEAEERRRRRADPAAPREIGGREGPDPVRYGDWEVKGLASDF
jgi:hypothetical protein